MKEYVENAKKVLSATTQKVVEKSTTLYSATKLSLKISKIKADVDVCYKKIGEIVYTTYKGGDAAGEEIEVLCNKIESLKAEIDEISVQIAEVKGAAVCANCGAEVKKDSTYCAKCGTEV